MTGQVLQPVNCTPRAGVQLSFVRIQATSNVAGLRATEIISENPLISHMRKLRHREGERVLIEGLY